MSNGQNAHPMLRAIITQSGVQSVDASFELAPRASERTRCLATFVAGALLALNIAKIAPDLAPALFDLADADDTNNENLRESIEALRDALKAAEKAP